MQNKFQKINKSNKKYYVFGTTGADCRSKRQAGNKSGRFLNSEMSRADDLNKDFYQCDRVGEKFSAGSY